MFCMLQDVFVSRCPELWAHIWHGQGDESCWQHFAEEVLCSLLAEEERQLRLRARRRTRGVRDRALIHLM